MLKQPRTLATPPRFWNFSRRFLAALAPSPCGVVPVIARGLKPTLPPAGLRRLPSLPSAALPDCMRPDIMLAAHSCCQARSQPPGRGGGASPFGPSQGGTPPRPPC